MPFDPETHLDEVGGGAYAHAGDGLPLAVRQAAVAGALAGEGAEGGDAGGVRCPGRPIRLIGVTEGTAAGQGVHNLEEEERARAGVVE